MAGYKPLYIKAMETGLVQSRQDFILPNDAYPILQNAFVWRERIKKKQGYEILGRLRRIITASSIGNISAAGAGTFTFDLFTLLGIIATEPNASFELGSATTITITIAAPIAQTLTDSTGTGTLTITGAGPITAASINYVIGVLSLTFSGVAALSAATLTGAYYSGLPAMGLRSRETNAVNSEQCIAFDTIYAYRFGAGGWQEFIPGTTWTGGNADFFWSTNYFVGDGNLKIFWVTNSSGTGGDPIRYTNGVVWVDFAPTITSAGGTQLHQCLAMLPFRGRLLAFNTLEGANLAGSTAYYQRIRWSAIGTPFSVVSAAVTIVNAQAWYDDVRGQGGFLDIPTAESIVSVGFVRDNLVIYCERSTWQLRYTGRAIQPFQIEKVNSELGAEGTFSTVQFDTSLVGIGDKGVVECDSFKSDRIDIKIPDLVFEFDNDHFGPQRVHGIRDFQQRLAYWTYPYQPSEPNGNVYPNRRLVYNYENDSWAIFTDSLTCLGTFQAQFGRTWANTHIPWQSANFPWISRSALFPSIIGGNQQGYILYLDVQATNDPSLFVQNITGNSISATVITSPDHNLETGQVISISGIPAGTPFANSLNNPLTGSITGATQANPCQITSTNFNLPTGSVVYIENIGGMVELNGQTYTITVTGANTFTLDGIDSTTFTAYTAGGNWIDQARNCFGIVRVDKDNFELWVYNPSTQDFSTPQIDAAASYVGGAQVSIRDNFIIQSKKFNFLDQGQNIQMGWIDVLLDGTESGAISLNVYLNYNNNSPINILPENNNSINGQPDTFFNSVVPTNQSAGINTTKNMKRVYCPTRGTFITVVWTLSNEQLIGNEQEQDVQIDAQILWVRPAGTQLTTT